MLLDALILPILRKQVVHFQDVQIASITADSRHVQAGSLFIALRGHTVDGHDYAKQSVAAGAVALLVEEEIPDLGVPQVIVPDTRIASAVVADVFYGHPSHHLRMIGVTGTNGKTTVIHLIERMLEDAGRTTGLYGTVGMRIGGVTTDVVNTTPEAVDLQGVLHNMVTSGCEYGIMEVSSHALELRRVAGTKYHVAVFTNLTQDHLDFHGSMAQYMAAKGKLFSRLGNEYYDSPKDMSYAVLNADDKASAYLSSQTVAECITYGIHQLADVRASDVRVTAEGVRFHVATFAGDAHVSMRMTGRFNVYNALAAISVGLIEGISLRDIVTSLEAVPGVPGRLESVSGGQSYTVLVDYSHTPDSLENALTTIREFATGKVFCVVGCGGDRDKTKRPLMARIAADNSDLVILTSDNPRTEDPERILDDMEAGLAQVNVSYERMPDRYAAIHHAIRLANAEDIVLIAGKGHETYQIVGTVKSHFDDREVAAEAIRLRDM